MEDASDPDWELIRCACLEAVTVGQSRQAAPVGAPKGKATKPDSTRDAFGAHADAPQIAFASLVYGLDSTGVFKNANADYFDAGERFGL